MDLKNKLEAILFSAARAMDVKELKKLTGASEEMIVQSLKEIRVELASRQSSLVLIDEQGKWKLTVRDSFLPIVQRIVSKTELDKPVLETLAVVAWKYPVLQADVIRVRHNKAYAHLKELEERGFITRVKHGRTKKIILTERFFEYFDIPKNKHARHALMDAMNETRLDSIRAIERQIAKKEAKEDGAAGFRALFG